MENIAISCEENRRNKRGEMKREYLSPVIEVIEISFGQSYLLFEGSGDGTESFDMPGDYW